MGIRSNAPGSNFPPGWLPPPSKPGVLSSFDGLHLVQFLGMGSMGMVFKALMDDRATHIKQTSKKQVAVKLLRPEFNENGLARSRFQKEIRIISRLRHPNIIAIPKIADLHGLSYFVMDFMEGGSLASRCAEDYSWKPEVIRDLILSVAEALEYCHSIGVIHRDIKPSNILFRENRQPILADFGLARTVWNDSMFEPNHSTPIGTPAYLSPKSARGESDDTRGDIYSLGAVLYELLSGRPPYSGPDVSSILEQIKNCPPTPISKLQPNAHPGLVKIAEQAMARELKDRYSEMKDMIRDLKAWQPSSAPGSSSSFSIGPRKFITNGGVNRSQKQWVTVFILAIITVSLVIWNLFLEQQSSNRKDPVEQLAETAESIHLKNPRLHLKSSVFLTEIDSWEFAKPGDWIGQGRMNFFHYNRESKTLKIINPDGSIFQSLVISSEFLRHFRLKSLFDVNRDGRDDLVFSWVKDDIAGLSFFNQHPHEFKTITVRGTSEQIEDGILYRNQIDLHEVVDIDGDGRLEALTTLNTGYELQPRALICFDLESGHEKWRQASGPWLNGIDWIPKGKYHAAFISAGGNALGNGAVGPDGLSDEVAHAYLFNGQGERLWSATLAKQTHVYVDTQITDLNRDGNPEVLALGQCAEFNDVYSEFGRIYQFDLNGEPNAEYNLNARSDNNWIVEDLDPEHAGLEVALMDRTGKLHVLDQQLKPIHVFDLGDGENSSYRIDLLEFTDLNKDGQKEWAILMAKYKLISKFCSGSLDDPPNAFEIRDIKLRVVSRTGEIMAEDLIESEWNHGFGYRGEVIDTDKESPQTILFLGSKLINYQYQE